MPNWADDEGRYHWTPPGKPWYDAIEIPHAPVIIRDGCQCPCCRHSRGLPPIDHPYKWSPDSPACAVCGEVHR